MTDGGEILPEAVGLTGEGVGASGRPGLGARLRRSLLGLSSEETQPARRGFQVSDPARTERLLRVGEIFLAGYHAALLDARPEPLATAIEIQVERGWRGFAYEGAGMGLALQDTLFPRLYRRPTRLREFLAGPAHVHRYLVLVGAGWTFARIPRRFGHALAGLDPTLRWLAFDGYGFHDGFFGWRRSILRHRVPRRLRGYARRAFDQGVGRSLWFVQGMEPARIAAAVDAFPEDRQGDLWSGIGLASAFAGGLPAAELTELGRLAGSRHGHVVQGVAFAAKARVESGEETAPLELACSVFCGSSAAEVAAITNRMADGLPDDGGGLAVAEPSYEVWRRRTREHFESDPGGGRKEVSA